MAIEEYDPGRPINFAPKNERPTYLRSVNASRTAPSQVNTAPLLLNKPVSRAKSDHVTNVRLLQATGILISIIWLVGASMYIQRMIGWQNISGLKPHEMGGFLAGILTPVALFWMIAAFIMRSNDVKIYAEALREEIQGMIFPSEEANRRVNNDIERLMRQTSEMSKATHIALSAIETAREGLRTQVNLLNTGSTETVDRLTTLGLSLTARMQDVAQVGFQLEQSLGRIEQSTVNANDKLLETNKQLQDSAELVGTSTQSTEEAVGRISQMLRDRLEALGSLHQQTEEVLKNAVTEIATQRENLLVDAGELENKAANIGNALSKGVDKLYAFSDESLDKAKLVETKLQAQTETLQNVLSQANDNISGIETATTEAVTRLKSTTQDAVNDSYKIEDILEQAISRMKETTKTALEETTSSLDEDMARLSRAIEEASSEAEEKLQTAEQNIHKATRSFTDEIDISSEKARKDLEDAIAFISGSANDALDNMTSTIDRNVDRLSQDIESAGNRAEEKLNTVHTTLQSAVSNLSREIDNSGDRAITNMQQIQDRLDQAVANLNQRSVETVQKAQSDMEEATERLISGVDDVGARAKTITDDMLSEVNRKVSDTTSAFAYIQNQIQALVGLFDERKLQLDETGLSARQTAEAMHQTLQAALDKVQKTTTVLQTGIGAIRVSVEEPINLLESVANMAQQRAGDIAELLSKQTSEISQSTRKMGEEATATTQNLQGKSQDIALLAGKIISQLKVVGQEMDLQGEKLDTRTEKSVAALEGLSNLQKNLVGDLGILQEKSQQISTQTETSTDAIKQRIDLLQQLHKSLTTDSDTSKAALDRVSDRIVSISTNTLDNIKNTLENMTLLEADYHRLSEAGVDSIERLSDGYRDTLDVIKSETEQTAQKIIGLQDDLQNSTLQANHFMQAHLANLQNTADNFGQTINKVSSFGDTIALHTDRIGTLGSEFLKGNEQISINARSVQDALGQMRDHTIEAVDSFMQHGSEIEGQMQAQIARLNNVNQNLVLNAREVKDNLSQSVDDTEALSQKITIQLGKIRNEGETVESALNNVLDRITHAGTQIAEQREEIIETSDELLNRLQSATQQISDKASALEKAAQEAQAQAEALRAQEAKFNQEAFFNSTKFIVESLHSLALDFTRMLDGELDEKTWKSYQKGDTGAFTRHMLSTHNEQTQTKIRGKFKEDVEFRTYVQRYLRQFEEIYDSAERNDHAHLLTSIFMTSDVGKLYQFICAILERDARGSKK